jgi:hypothetical protein
MQTFFCILLINNTFIMRKSLILFTMSMAMIFLHVQCNSPEPKTLVAAESTFNGFESEVEWGRHLVTVSACHDCHSPKKMTAEGMVIDSSRMLAGHMAGSPEPDVNKKELQQKGLVVTNDLTTWVGPWGTSYTANLTSDATGIGNWTEAQFILAIKEGKYKGLPGSRSLLPPMPWQMYRNLKDEELKAIFAYLQTTTPVKNVVPEPLPPAAK